MSLSVGIASSECVISRSNAIVSNIKGVIESMRTVKGECFMCKYEPTTTETKETGVTCKCDLKTPCKDGHHWEPTKESKKKD